MNIAIINGPNLHRTGTREPAHYGYQTFEDLLKELKNAWPKIEFKYFQSNLEGEIIEEIYLREKDCVGIILNAGGYSHTSVAIADAISAINKPVIEVHLSNLYKREEYRHVSLTGSRCLGCISGLGMLGYKLGVEALLRNGTD